MIVVLLDQKGDVGKTTPALHLTEQWASEGKRVTLIDADHPLIDAPLHVTGQTRQTLLATNLILPPAQPSSFDGQSSAEMFGLPEEADNFRADLPARFAIDPCAVRTSITRERAKALVDPPAFASRIGRRVAIIDLLLDPLAREFPDDAGGAA